MITLHYIAFRKKKQEVVQKAKDDLAAEEEYSSEEEEEEVRSVCCSEVSHGLCSSRIVSQQSTAQQSIAPMRQYAFFNIAIR